MDEDRRPDPDLLLREVEEERRLAYVAITRAREELYLYHAESRMIFGTTRDARDAVLLGRPMNT